MWLEGLNPQIKVPDLFREYHQVGCFKMRNTLLQEDYTYDLKMEAEKGLERINT